MLMIGREKNKIILIVKLVLVIALLNDVPKNNVESRK